MTEKEFIESQKECADMLGMSYKEYLEYCKNVKKVDSDENTINGENNTLEFLNSLGLDERMLKTRKDD